jgi:hypothetical protein
MIWRAGYVVRMGEKRAAYEVLVWNPEEKRALRRPRCRWEDDDVKIVGLKEIGSKSVDWIHLDRDHTVTNLWVGYNAGNFLSSWSWLLKNDSAPFNWLVQGATGLRELTHWGSRHYLPSILFIFAASNSDYIASNCMLIVNDGLEWVWKEAPWPKLRCYLVISLQGPRKTTKTSIKTIGFPGKIWPSTSRIQLTPTCSGGRKFEFYSRHECLLASPDILL